MRETSNSGTSLAARGVVPSEWLMSCSRPRQGSGQFMSRLSGSTSAVFTGQWAVCVKSSLLMPISRCKPHRQRSSAIYSEPSSQSG
jgi:hypothetical protein